MSKLRRQMSYNASLSTMLVTSVCSSKECTHSTVLYGSTTAVATWGHDDTVNESLLFFAVIHRQPLKHQTAQTRSGT